MPSELTHRKMLQDPDYERAAEILDEIEKLESLIDSLRSEYDLLFCEDY